MATIQTTPAPSIRRMTAAEFEALPDHGGLELDDSCLVEMNVGMDSSWIGGEIFGQLWQHVRQHKSGWVFPREIAFNRFSDNPNRIRKPDASFVRVDETLDGESIVPGLLLRLDSLFPEPDSPTP